jgi:hypothetical protein
MMNIESWWDSKHQATMFQYGNTTIAVPIGEEDAEIFKWVNEGGSSVSHSRYGIPYLEGKWDALLQMGTVLETLIKERAEATDALMATIGEYAAPWYGDDLDPEIVDAEFYDCPGYLLSVKFPVSIGLTDDDGDRRRHYSDIEEAMEALMATVTELSDTGGWAFLFIKEMDADLYDCPLSLESLK